MRRTPSFFVLLLLILSFVSLPSQAQAATSWTPPVTVSADGMNASGDGVQFAAGPNNIIAATWAHFIDGGYVIQASVTLDSGLTWSSPSTVSQVGNHAEAPHIAINNSGEIMVVWSEETDLWRVRFATSLNNGQSWSTYNTISNPAYSTGEASLVAVGNNGFTVLLSQYNGVFADVYSRSTSDAGVSWSTQTLISDGSHNSAFTDIAADNNGNVSAVWLTNLSGQYEIQARSSSNGGLTWASIVDLSPGVNASVSPRVSSPSSNTFTASWNATDGALSYIATSTSLDAGQNWSAVVQAVSEAGSNPQFNVAIGPHGVLALIWKISSGTTTTLYVTSSTDFGATWESPKIIFAADSSETYPIEKPKIVITSQGVMVVAWAGIFTRDGDTDLVSATTSFDLGTTWTPVKDISSPGSSLVSLVSNFAGNVVAGFPAVTAGENVVAMQTSSLLDPLSPDPLPDTGSPSYLPGLSVAAIVIIITGLSALCVRPRRLLTTHKR